MKFKELLLVCVILTVSSGIKADFKTRFAKAKTFVKENTCRIAKVALSDQAVAKTTLSTGALCTSLVCNSILINDLITLRNSRSATNCTFLMGGLCTLYSTYRMFNDDLDNKPNKLFKNLMQQVKTRLPKSKLNEQK